MFAFLALAGDLGATVSPVMVGSLAELAGGNLKSGLLAATAFPAVLTLGLLILKRQVHRNGISIGFTNNISYQHSQGSHERFRNAG